MKKLFEEMLNGISKEMEISRTHNRNSRTLIIDGLNNYIRIWVMTPTLNEDGEHIGGVIGFLRTLGVAIRTIKPTRVIIAFDGAGGSKRRKKIYPEYKANRGGGTRLNRVHDWGSDEEEKKMMIYQMKRLIQYLRNLPISIMMIDDIEADDTIAYVANEFFGEEQDNKLWIMSTDKDFYQLINKNISIYNPVKKKIIDLEIFKENYGGINNENFILLKSMIGDPGDNIPGIRGFGEKTVMKTFPILTENKKLSVSDIIEYTNGIEKKSKLHQKLLDNSQQYELNYQLIKLDSSFIFPAARMKILSIWNEYPPKVNKINIIQNLIYDKASQHFKDINGWLDENFSYLNSFIS